MRISSFSVHRPKLTAMVALIVVILGIVSLRQLPIDLMPDITYPTLTISATYENASPQEIEELVTRPIEEAMSAVPGVEEVSSESSEGKSRVRVAFSWDMDLDIATNDVRDRLDRVISQLPEDMDRPNIMKFDPSSMPVLIMGASSNMDSMQLRKVIDEQVKYRIERVPGVAALDVMGGLEREIQVNLHLDKVKALEIPLEQILAAIKSENITLPAGTVERGHYEIIIRVPGEYTNLDQLRNTTVATLKGVPVRVKDIASVEDTSQKVTRIVRVNGRPGIHLSVTKQSGKNTVQVANSVLGEVDRINKDFPQIELIPIIDTSNYIKRSISSIGSSVLYGGLFAVFVLLFFLRNIRSTAIIAVAIPISIIAAFALIYFAGFTLNIMTLGGLALGVGMLVDNSIVVLENIFRLREGGLSAGQAAVDGSKEVESAVIASTLTTVAVFLPLIFVQGMAGVMFKQLALVVSFSLICSLTVALTLVPMLASKYLHATLLTNTSRETLAHKLFLVSGSLFSGFEKDYKVILHWAISHRAVVVTCVAILFSGSFLLAPFVGVELMPQSDEGEVRIDGEMEVGTKLSKLDEKFQVIDSVIVHEVSELKSMVANVGGGLGPMSSGGHTGDIRIALKCQAERERSSEQVASGLRRLLSAIPGINVRTRAGTGMFTMMLRGPGGGTERVQVEIRGYDMDVADALAQKVKQTVESVKGITDAEISRKSGSPEELIIVDRPKAADMRLTVSSIARMLQTALGGSTASYFRQGGDEYEIAVRLENAENMGMDDILDLPLMNADGDTVMLRNVVDIRSHSGPVSIERKDQERIVTISANTGGRDLSSILRDIQKNIQSIPVPNGFTIGLAGEYEQQQETFSELAIVLLLALVLVYMVMVCLYESFRDPFVVMFSVPLAAIGVIWVLFLTGTTFNMQSFIGCIMLGGIVVNNAIILVDQINLLRQRDNMPLNEAIGEAGRRRLRPILMTTLTTIMGLVPMALGMGEGGEFQAPLGRAVIGGLFSAAMITLVVVPVVYAIFQHRLTVRKDISAGISS